MIKCDRVFSVREWFFIVLRSLSMLKGGYSSIFLWAIPFMWALLLSSCMRDETWVSRNKPNISADDLESGHPVIILNEGNFMYGNSSISYYDASTGKLWNDVYYNQNGSPLGDVAFSATLNDGLLYVIVNNSGKVIALNFGKYPTLKAFTFISKITGLTSPRYMYFVNGRKALVSDLYARAVAVVDPTGPAITGYISTDNHSGLFYQHPTEQFGPYGDYLFTNCYSYDDKILVLDPEAGTVVDSIEVLKQPSAMVLDKNLKLWVICDGGYEDSDYGDDIAGLVRIDAKTRTVERIFPFEKDKWPSELHINSGRDTLYFINGDVWKMAVDATELPGEAFISAESEKLFYSLGIDPVTSEIYVGDAIDNVQPGVVYRYTAQGLPEDTLRVGIIPGAFCFPVKMPD
jgi:hypothetical protein